MVVVKRSRPVVLSKQIACVSRFLPSAERQTAILVRVALMLAVVVAALWLVRTGAGEAVSQSVAVEGGGD